MESIDKCVIYVLVEPLFTSPEAIPRAYTSLDCCCLRKRLVSRLPVDGFETESSKNDRDIVQFKVNILTVQAPAPAWVDTADN